MERRTFAHLDQAPRASLPEADIAKANIAEASRWLNHPFFFRLSPRQQQLFLLKYNLDGFAQRSYRQVADVLELSNDIVTRNAVRVNIVQGKKTLSKIDIKLAMGESMYANPQFSKLPERQQLVLSGHFGSGELPPLTNIEIAVSLGITHQAVSASIKSALRKFVFV